MKERNRIRIRDIAERAGCSAGTVDRVIHNRGRVSGEARERILGIMKELDYKPNVNARVLASRHVVTLGILLPSFRKGEFWELPNRGIEEAVERYRQQGYRIIPRQATYDSPERFFAEGMKMVSGGIDGIIMNPASFRETIRLVRAFFQNNKPFILIDSDIRGVPSLSFIGKDPVQSGLTAGRLIHQITRHIPGCKRVWIIHLSKSLDQMYALLARETGFMSYFSGKGLQEEYAFRSFDIEDRGSQKLVDRHLSEMLGEETPHAVYVTGSKVHKIAPGLKRLKPGPRPLLVGHDLIRANIRGVRDESIDFLLDEEAERQGYLAVESMIRSIVHKEEIEKEQLMNLMIFTRENLPSDPPDQGG
jgi:LacI family transcriptional regulator